MIPQTACPCCGKMLLVLLAEAPKPVGRYTAVPPSREGAAPEPDESSASGEGAAASPRLAPSEASDAMVEPA